MLYREATQAWQVLVCGVGGGSFAPCRVATQKDRLQPMSAYHRKGFFSRGEGATRTGVRSRHDFFRSLTLDECRWSC